MHSPESNDSLSGTLRAWRVSPARDPQFRARVWARISAAGAALPWGSYVRQHPAIIGGALALAIALGALTGHERARSHSAQLAAAYVQTYDARTLQLAR